MARYGRRGRQTRRYRRINWGRFLLFLVLLVALAAVIYFMIQVLTGGIRLGGGSSSSPSPSNVQTLTDLPSPTPAAGAGLPEDVGISPKSPASATDLGLKSDIMVNGEQVSSYQRQPGLSFGPGTGYTGLPGIITFGGNNYRNTFTYGTQTLTQKTLTRVWEQPTGSLSTDPDYGTWTGTGWTGQPLIVQWPEETRRVLGVHDAYRNKEGFTEVIYAAMDGYLYFLELESGEQTRDPLYLGVTTKGTGSLDPRGYPLLYTGQGIPSTESDGSTGAWLRIVDLIENKVIWRFGGVDRFAHRRWQAYDSSPLVDAEADTLIAPGENGVVYTVKLNSAYDPASGTVSVNPEGLVKYRYILDGYDTGGNDDETKRWVGIENSMAVWRNYGFFTDNGGRLQCLDLNTLEPQYVVDVTDDSDASIVIEEDVQKKTFYLYTANEVDKQPGARQAGTGKAYHRKLDGRTGEILWENEFDASFGNTSSNGGTLTTPHVGRGKLSHMVIYNATMVPVTFVNSLGETVSQDIGGRIIAYDKQTGEELWRFEQADGYWSSPVVVYDAQGNGYLIQCDRWGIMRIHDPLSGGKIIAQVDLGSRIESTPAVFGDWLVVGTRGTHGAGEQQKIIGVKIG